MRYAVDRNWTLELTAANLFDKRYEHAVGYDAPRRGFLLGVRFERAVGAAALPMCLRVC